jgi:4-hydroxybenzoate polyprenyltransferase/phosphoserine phosphatase
MAVDVRLEKSAGGDAVGAQRVLFVDLDGTLVRTDLLHEGLVLAAKRGFGSLGGVLWRLVRDKASGKRLLAERFTPDVGQLPYRADVLAFLAEQRSQGVKVVLATGSDSRWATKVADQVGLFDDVLASDGERNLKGEAKLQALEEYCRQHGYSSFDYMGDSAADVHVWRRADRAHVMEPTSWLLKSVKGVSELGRVFGKSPARAGPAIKALRPRQWVKNLLVFAPLLLAHEFSSIDKLLASVAAFVAFSLCASAMYVVNDLVDMESDRHHPEKSRRPFASGALPVAWGPPLALSCLCAGLLVGGVLLPAAFLAMLVGYVLLTSMYSGWLKQVVLVDVLVLSGLYTSRVVAGGLATEVAVSEWLMGFCLFLFLSLGFAKRYSELTRLEEEGDQRARGRGYRVSDWGLIESMGPTNGYLAVLVFALYIHSEEMTRLYANGWALWLICPLLIYWISRVWVKARRRELSEDPVLFAVKDRVSLLVAALIVVLVAVARPM